MSPAPKPKRGNRGQAHRDDVAKRQTAQRRTRQDPAPPAGRQGRRPTRQVTPEERARTPRPVGLGGDQVEGRRAVRELLFARRRRVRDVWISDSAEDSPLLAEIVDLATEGRVPIRRVAKSRLDNEARTDAPQGVLAHAEPLREHDLERLARTTEGARPFLLALDGITDPQNVGALLRTAESAGVTGVLLPKHRAAHITPSATKSAAGAIEWLPMALVPGIPNALARLQELGVWTVGLDGDAEQRLFDLDLADQAVCLVMGAEGEGLSRLTRTRCDVLVSIPQRGRLASMNVAAAGAVACFEVARRRTD